MGPWRRANAVARRAKGNQRQTIRFRLQNPIANQTPFASRRIVFKASLQPRRNAIDRRCSPTGPRQFCIDISQTHHDVLLNLPRTEEAAFAWSARSRRDLQRRGRLPKCHSGQERNSKNRRKQKSHRLLQLLAVRLPIPISQNRTTEKSL